MATRASEGTGTLKHAANRQMHILKYAYLAFPHTDVITAQTSPNEHQSLVLQAIVRLIMGSLLKLQVL